jgi:uncharacterized DUF497 family protein
MTKGLKFVWDVAKAVSNLQKHGVSFEEAATVFADVLAITIPDPEHGHDEEIRELTIGQTARSRIVVVSHTERDGRIRIISARKADRSESKQYNEEP